jgi:hypothetical protein
MKLIRMLAIASLVLTLGLLLGCATNGVKQTPAQVAANICPVLSADLTIAQAGVASVASTDPSFAKVSGDLTIFASAVNGVCTAAATSASLQALAVNALPALSDLVASLPSLTAAQKAKIQGDLALLQTALGVALAIEQANVPVAPASASSTH